MSARGSAIIAALVLAAAPSASGAEGEGAGSGTGVPPGWSTLTTVHFEFVHHPGAASRVKQIALGAEEDLARVLDVVGLEDIAPIEVVICRNTDEMARVKPGPAPPSWATGMALRDRRLVLFSLTAPDGATPTGARGIFLHEVVHVATWDAAGGRDLPIWFSEGLAVWMSGENAFERRKVLVEASLTNGLLPLDSLSRHYPGDGRAVNVAYAQSADVVGFIETEFGPGLVRKLLGRVGRGDDFRSALESLAGRSIGQIEREWMDRLDVWYRWIPSITGGATLWILIAGLLATVYVRRRRQAKVIRERWEREEAERRRIVQDWVAEHWDPSTIPRPTEDRSRVVHDGSTYTLH